MKRPIGVSILAVFFLGLAAGWLFNAVACLLTASGDTATQVSGLLELVVAFLLTALGLGLWDLEEDARRVAMALFSLPVVFGAIGSLSAFSNPAEWGDLVPAMMYLLVAATPAAYLMRPKVKGAFDQLVVVSLRNER